MPRNRTVAIIVMLAAMSFALPAGAQATKEDIAKALAENPDLAAQVKDRLASDPDLFLTLANKGMKWDVPAEPFHMGGPLYFVGTQGIGIFLFTTSDGFVLMNTGMPGSGEMIAESIRKLGLEPMDIKLILTSHAHIDHAAGHAYLQKLTGAKVPILAEEEAKLASGGAIDFFYGAYGNFHYDPPKIDQVIRDGDTIKLGDMAFTAHHTPGHSSGSTTWMTSMVVDGKVYSVIVPDGFGANPGYRVQVNPSAPGLGDDFRRSLAFLELQKPDIWLSLHNDLKTLATRRERSATEGIAAWVDPEGYRQLTAMARAEFEALVASEVAGN